MEDHLKDFVFSLFKNHKKFLIITIIFSLFLFGSVHYALNSYFDNASREVVENWYANELTSIQQGNVLSSVTKLQRTLNRSALVKGVRVIDNRGRELVRFGKVSKVIFNENLSSNLSEQDLGVFAKAYAFRSGDLDIFIITESRGLLALVGILGIYLFFITLGFAMFVRANAVKEEKIRAEMSMQQLRLENEYNERIANISRSVSHDIRSPLSVLNIIGDKMKTDFPEEGLLLGEVSKRIIQIADGLLNVSRKSFPQLAENTHSLLDVNPVIKKNVQIIIRTCQQSVAEKRLELGLSEIRIQFCNEVTRVFNVICDDLALSRIVSNLLNNSIEAIGEIGFISLTLSETDEGLLVEIRDSGPGLSDELIAKIYNGPVSEGKNHGNGIGLWSAIEQVRSWQGKLQIRSNLGTTISIILKKADSDS